MSIASRIFLAAALAVSLTAPGGARAAMQGFSIDLGTPMDPLTLDWNPAGGLSAAAAPSNGKGALALKNNGSYFTTLTGNYDVVDDLGSLDKNKSVLWLRSYEFTLNGQVIFDVPDEIVGPFTGEDIWQAALFAFNQFTGLPSADLNVIIAVLMHFDSFQTNGEFDYAYNTLNQPSGTFAVGTTESLGERILLNVGTNTLSFDASLFAVPEPPTWLMLMAGGAGLLVIRGLVRRLGVARRVPA